MTTTVTPALEPVTLDDARASTTVGGSLSNALSSKLGRVVVWALCLLWTVPTFGLLITSFRPERELKTTGWWTVFTEPKFTLDNYRDALASRSSGGQMTDAFINTVKIAIPSTIIPIVIASLAAYAFSWMTFKGRDWLFVAVVGLMVVPLQMALIPLLQLFTGGAHIGSITIIPDIGLSESVVNIWFAHACFAMPLAIFLLKNFIGALPRELMEAARVDGAGHLTTFYRIVIPLSVPALASLGIFQFLWVWNDYLVGLVFGGTDNRPMTVRVAELAGSRGNEWQRLTSAAFISMVVPLLVFFSLQRYFVRGLTAGSVKG